MEPPLAMLTSEEALRAMVCAAGIRPSPSTIASM